jgi:hypothetical protein
MTIQPTRSKFFSMSSSNDDGSSEAQAASSAESSALTTPEASPVKDNKVSPVSGLETMLQKITPDRDLNGQERTEYRRSMEWVTDQNTPERNIAVQRLSDAHRRAVVTRLFTNGDEEQEGILCLGKLQNKLGWVTDLLAELRRCSKSADIDWPVFLNWDHIAEPSKAEGKSDKDDGKSVGFHFCPLNHPFHADIGHKVTNPFSHVWCGDYKEKFSTFFPLEIQSKKHLVWLLSQAQECFSEDNKAILEIPRIAPPEPSWPALAAPFHIEVYKRAEGTILWSAFPLFYFAKYEPDATFHITDTLKISAQEALDLITPAVRGNRRLIQYDIDDFLYVDIAPFIDGCPISRGILIGFPADQIFN